MEQLASPEVFIIDEVTQLEGDEVTEVVTEHFVLVTEMMPVPEEISVDPIPTPAPCPPGKSYYCGYPSYWL